MSNGDDSRPGDDRDDDSRETDRPTFGEGDDSEASEGESDERDREDGGSSRRRRPPRGRGDDDSSRDGSRDDGRERGDGSDGSRATDDDQDGAGQDRSTGGSDDDQDGAGQDRSTGGSDDDSDEADTADREEASSDRERSEEGGASDRVTYLRDRFSDDETEAPRPEAGGASEERGGTDETTDESVVEETSDSEDDADYGELEGESVLPVRREYVEDLLIDLGRVAESSGFHSLYEEIHDDRLPALREGEMSVVVLGEFNHGKTTVINALMGEQVLPVGITPTTSVITHLVHDDKPSATLHPGSGETPYEIGYDEIDDVIREEREGSGEEPEYLEIGYPNDLLSDSLVLVDTPGVNDISRQKVEITYGYVPRADVILYVLDATQILKKSEITFIQDRLLEANRDRIIFVLGKIDALSDEEAEEVEAYARERLESMVGDVDLYAFSQRDALDAQQEEREPPEAFREFRSELLEFLRDQKAEIIVDSALGGGLRVASLLEQNLAIEEQAYQLEREELEERIERVRSKLRESRELIADNIDLIDERIGGIAATARHNLHVFRDEFIEELPRQIEAADARDVQLYLSAWIQDQFKQWLEEEGADIAKSLEDLAEEVIQVTNESIQETVETFRDEFGLAEELDLDVDTVAYDMSVFALGTVGLSVLFLANTLVGGLLTAATPVLAMFLKGKVDEKIKERAREEGEQAIREATDAIEDELMRVIYEYGDELKDFVETAGDRLYRQVQEALSQVRREMDTKDREAALEDVRERLEKVRAVAAELGEKREELESYEQSD